MLESKNVAQQYRNVLFTVVLFETYSYKVT